MGVDLTLVVERQKVQEWILAYERLSLDRDRDLFRAIGDGPSTPMPADTRFTWYGDGGLEDLREDGYGNPLAIARAGDLAKVTKDEPTTSRWNLAVLAFLGSIDPDTRVVLWWH